MKSRVADSITRRFVGAYEEGSASSRMRLRRFDLLVSAFPDLREMRVLDLGGDARFWRSSPLRPGQVTLLNRYPQDVPEPWMTAIRGDGCDPPELPTFDLAFSNSVIEHVGGHWRRERFADVVRGAAPRYWVQTPYRYFPVEPHYLCPGLQFLPLAIRPKVIVRWPLGHHRKDRDSAHALEGAMNIELLSVSEMRFYFPGASLQREKFAGMTKSLIAVRQ